MSNTYNIRDWPRGTNPPIKISLSDIETGAPVQLVGCVVVLVIRKEKWEDSKTDDTALVKRRVACHSAIDAAGLQELPGVMSGDICWLLENGRAVAFDGSEWTELNSVGNNILEGELTIRLTREEMLLPVGIVYYSIDILLPDGEVVKALKGKIRITDNTVNVI
ncbi:MAG: hypothetical protein FWD27_00675 [Coriobacteriia bacterium]|nr:hypothetical protein [Coriobacteriia bacterium]